MGRHLEVHVDEGLHWFKAGHPALQREVELRRVLTRLEWFAALPAGHPCHLDAAGRGRALAAMARVVDCWESVRPDVTDLTIDHNGLHAGNPSPGPLISDRGDAVVGLPFGSLRPLLNIALHTFGNDAAEDVRRAYLSQWSEPAELNESLDVAIQLAVPSRLMCWQALDSPTTVGEYAQYVRPLWEEIGHDIESLTHP